MIVIYNQIWEFKKIEDSFEEYDECIATDHEVTELAQTLFE